MVKSGKAGEIMTAITEVSERQLAVEVGVFFVGEAGDDENAVVSPVGPTMLRPALSCQPSNSSTWTFERPPNASRSTRWVGYGVEGLELG